MDLIVNIITITCEFIMLADMGGGMMSLIFKPFLEGSWEGGGGGYTSVKKKYNEIHLSRTMDDLSKD